MSDNKKTANVPVPKNPSTGSKDTFDKGSGSTAPEFRTPNPPPPKK